MSRKIFKNDRLHGRVETVLKVRHRRRRDVPQCNTDETGSRNTFELPSYPLYTSHTHFYSCLMPERKAPISSLSLPSWCSYLFLTRALLYIYTHTRAFACDGRTHECKIAWQDITFRKCVCMCIYETFCTKSASSRALLNFLNGLLPYKHTQTQHYARYLCFF